MRTAGGSVHEVADYFATLLEFGRRYQRVPGVQAAVFADGKIVWSAAYGYADVERGVPLTDRHLFRVASHSKAFTATAVLQLSEQGRLRLDDTAAAHVPELTDVPIGGATLRDLLGHAAGVIRDGHDGDFWQLDHPFPDRERLRGVLRTTGSVVLPPCDRFKYSNIGYGLLGLVVEAASGLPYETYVRREILDRLAVPDLAPDLDRSRLDDYAVGYSSLAYADARVPIDQVETGALSPAAGFHGTAAGLVRFYAALLPGDDRLLSDASRRRMRHPAWPVRADDPGRRYGLGLSVERIGDRDRFGHSGAYPGHLSQTLADDGRRTVVAVLTNAIDGPAQQWARAFHTLVDLAESATPDTSRADLRRFTGRFARIWGVRDVAVLGGRLFMLDPALPDPAADAVELDGVDEHTLCIAGQDGYGSYGEPMSYAFDAEGNVLAVRGPSGTTLRPLASYEVPERITVRRGVG